jgi:hypothetical protein
MRSARKTFTSDWYGTSRLFANSLSSSSIDSGRRREIVLHRGLEFRQRHPLRLFPVNVFRLTGSP